MPGAVWWDCGSPLLTTILPDAMILIVDFAYARDRQSLTLPPGYFQAAGSILSTRPVGQRPAAMVARTKTWPIEINQDLGIKIATYVSRYVSTYYYNTTLRLLGTTAIRERISPKQVIKSVRLLLSNRCVCVLR